jgi:hypothetical protein
MEIIATEVSESKRLDFLPDHFGSRNMLIVEQTVYSFMGQLCADYQGGYWRCYSLSNGGAFMAPAMDDPVKMAWRDNGYSGSMSAQAAGIVATMFTLSNLSFAYPEAPQLADQFHLLRDFALDHKEAGAIFAATD